MPPRIARLPRDHRGFPVPWFVTWFVDGKAGEFGEGEPDFRCADERKLIRAARQPICWVCGDQLGRHRVFTIGPMCAVNRVISEPPSHRDCAEFSVKACPFLSRPRMRRNELDLPEQRKEAGGFAIMRNPGVICLWETPDYRVTKAQRGNAGILFSLGEPTRVDWYAEGRKATRDEVLSSITSGMPLLMDMAQRDGMDGIRALERQRERVNGYLPAAA
jgi:hypothetical protein